MCMSCTLEAKDPKLIEDYIQKHNELVCENRRDLLKKTTGVLAGCAGLGLFGVQPALAKQAVKNERELIVHTPALGETSRVIYWIPGEGYIRESLEELSWALRDRRTGTAMLYDPHVLDQLYALTLNFNYNKPVHVLSGYRSPQSNRTVGGAKQSQHMEGHAIDLRMPGIGAHNLQTAAISLNAGGVGYYGRSGFIHIDSGPIRRWNG